VYPLAGKLVVFFTCDDAGEVDPYAWHGGAAVGNGHVGSINAATMENLGDDNAPTTNTSDKNCHDPASNKWILQLFKELPLGARSSSRAKGAFISASRRRAVELVASDCG
jgi:hypothetical protein